MAHHIYDLVVKLIDRKGVKRMAKNEQTSKKVASQASKLLSNPKTPAVVKSVAASALTQAPNKKRGK